MKLHHLLLPAMCMAALLPAAAAAQTINTVAGNGGSGTTGDGGLATAAETGYPVGVLAAPDGGFYIGGYNIVRRVRADGTIHTVAGDGTFASSGDGGPASAATSAAWRLAPTAACTSPTPAEAGSARWMRTAPSTRSHRSTSPIRSPSMRPGTSISAAPARCPS